MSTEDPKIKFYLGSWSGGQDCSLELGWFLATGSGVGTPGLLVLPCPTALGSLARQAGRTGSK